MYFSFLLPSHLRELLSGDEVADVDELEFLRLGGTVQLDREALVDAAEDLYSAYIEVFKTCMWFEEQLILDAFQTPSL